MVTFAENMESAPMKILLMGDASNCHRALATGLRRLGHEVTVVSDGTGWMNTQRDIDIKRGWRNKFGGLALWLRMNLSIMKDLKDYDVVSITNPVWLSLRPHRNRYFFDLLKDNNRSIFLTALGTDTAYVNACLDPESPLKYSEFRLFGHRAPYDIEHPDTAIAWTTGELKEHCEYTYREIDGAVSVLYEYDVAMRRVLPDYKVAYGGIPIELDTLERVAVPRQVDCVNLFLGRHAHRIKVKGTDLLEKAALRVVARHPGRCRLTLVENRPYDEYLRLLKSAHLVMDQVYSYTPATNALLAMGYGLNTLSGAEPEFYDFIGEKDNRPIINAVPDEDALTAAIEDFVMHPGLIAWRGEQSRRFVEKHNDCVTVAQRFVDFWTKRLEETGR